MRRLCVTFCLLLAACGAAPQEKLPQVPIVKGWPRYIQGPHFGQVSAVDVDARGRVYVLHRPGRPWVEPFPKDPIAAPTVAVFDGKSGALLEQWGAGQMVMPHGLSIDPQGQVWITDAGREQVLRYSPDGKLELAIGTRGVTGDDTDHFGRPTDVAFDGDRVLVSDGYLNARVAIFDREGHFLGQFGSKGNRPGQFDLPHSIVMAGHAITVADRENGRIELFEPDGTFRALWDRPGIGHPYAVKSLPDGNMLSVEGRDNANRQGIVLRVYRRDGSIVRSVAVASVPGGASRGHDLAISRDGFAYIADVSGDRVIKIALNRLETH